MEDLMHMQRPRFTQKGFSLIELLVVVAIIGVLAAAGVYAYTMYLASTKSEVTASNLKTLDRALKADLLAAQAGTAASSELLTDQALSSTSSCEQIAVAIVGKLNNKFKNPYYPAGKKISEVLTGQSGNQSIPVAAAYGNAMTGGVSPNIFVKDSAKLVQGALIVSCADPAATPNDPQFKIYECACLTADCQFDSSPAVMPADTSALCIIPSPTSTSFPNPYYTP